MKKIALLFFFFSFITFANKLCAIQNITIPTDNAKTVNHEQWDALLKKHVSSSGKVDYKGFLKNKNELNNYLRTLENNIPNKSWSKNAVLAYWINTYNAYTIKLIIDNLPVKSIKEINNPWGKKNIKVGDQIYSLEQIENQFLRKMNDPRVHFSINCASYSCPNLSKEAYTESKLNKQLTQAAKNFINDKSKNTFGGVSKIEISEIFEWFENDFKTKGSLIDFLNEYSHTKISNNAKITYKDYNWNLNE